MFLRRILVLQPWNSPLRFKDLFNPMQAQFSQMRPPAMVAPVNPRMPMYPPGAPGLGQQLFYGQGPPALIPPQVIVRTFTSYYCTHKAGSSLGLLDLYLKY